MDTKEIEEEIGRIKGKGEKDQVEMRNVEMTHGIVGIAAEREEELLFTVLVQTREATLMVEVVNQTHLLPRNPQTAVGLQHL